MEKHYSGAEMPSQIHLFSEDGQPNETEIIQLTKDFDPDDASNFKGKIIREAKGYAEATAKRVGKPVDDIRTDLEPQDRTGDAKF